MIIVRLSGGLGNQMFQYAAARRLAQVHGAVLRVDTSRLENTEPGDTPREYELGCFRIEAGMASAAERELCADLAKKWRKPLFRAMRKCGFLPSKNRVCYYRERSFYFDGRVLGLPDNVCLDGYWQSEKYFRDIRDTLIGEFTLRDGPAGENVRLAEQIEACDSVSLHVRRGDYVANPAAARFHGICGLDYYSGAIGEIRKKVASPHLFVFSDDPEWAAANLRPEIPATFVDHNGAAGGGLDMYLMGLCRHNIIANSSFSWWGAWLNENSGKTVIAPAQWFREPGMDTRDLVPEGWLRI